MTINDNDSTKIRYDQVHDWGFTKDGNLSKLFQGSINELSYSSIFFKIKKPRYEAGTLTFCSASPLIPRTLLTLSQIRPLFLYFNLVWLTIKFCKFLPMLGFKPPISGVGSNRSASCATNTVDESQSSENWKKNKLNFLRLQFLPQQIVFLARKEEEGIKIKRPISLLADLEIYLLAAQ